MSPTNDGRRMNLAGFLQDLAPGPIHFMPNPGNAGDALIAYATYRLFEREGIAYRICREGEELTGKVVVYGGGGNFVEYYENCSRFIARHHRSASHVVILPHTIRGHEGLLAELGSNVTIFCRERDSLDHVRKNVRFADVRLGDDMALEIDPEEVFLSSIPNDPKVYPSDYRRKLRSWRLRRLGFGLKRGLRSLASGDSGGDRVLYCMREDVERTAHARPVANFDLSRQAPFEFEMHSEICAARTTRLVFEFLNDYDVVHSNRLHLAMAAALLGKRVHLYANAYPKNEAMYRDVLAARFPNMSWTPSR